MKLLKNQIILLYLVLFLSGVAGLGYEMVWTRMLAAGLGHEIAAVLAVVGAFFSGMALGALALSNPISRSRRPYLWYAALESVIGFWALALIMLIPATNQSVNQFIGIEPSVLRHWSISFLIPFVLFLPATFAMGGTLPAMERIVSSGTVRSQSVGGLYAANTFGAVAGIIITTYLLVPAAGYRSTLLVLAALNFICAAGMAGTSLLRNRLYPVRISMRPAEMPEGRIYLLLFCAGLLGIGYEVLTIRVISQVLENTVYSFASALSVYLIGTAAGAALYQILLPQRRFVRVLTYLLTAEALLCLLGILLLQCSETIYYYVLALSRGNFPGIIMAEMALALAVFFPQTVVMGALFSHLSQSLCSRQGGFGRALSLNTAGAAFSPLLFGVVLLPLLGSKAALTLIPCGYILLMFAAGLRQHRFTLCTLLCAAPVMASPVNLQFVALPPGGSLVEQREGVMAAVTVVSDGSGDRYLKVNNKFYMGSTKTVFVDQRLGHIPLLLHPRPATALFLGIGTGVTLSAAADHPGLQADGVELVPEILPLLKHFAQATGDLARQHGLRLFAADARRFVGAATKQYDVIVADLFHPARDGAGTLYTAEHFTAIKARLAPGGLFCQWLPLYQLDAATLRVIIRTFLYVYPHGCAYIACYSLDMPVLGLVGAQEPLHYPADWYEGRVHAESLRGKLRNLRLPDIYELLGCFVAASPDLAAFSGSGPLNTDDKPVVMYGAPRAVEAAGQPAYETLFALLEVSRPTTAQLLVPPRNVQQEQVHQRLADYWAARDSFLQAGAGMRRTQNPRELLAGIRKPLLACVRKSRDFAAAYDPLLALAYEMYRTDPSAARELLVALEDAQPASDRARTLRKKLFPENS